MNLNELHEAVAEIAAKADRFNPYYSLRIQIAKVGDELKWTYACYMDPNHKTHDEFTTPEDLIGALRRSVENGPLVRGKPIDGALEVTE